jgi:hypothetical protein
MPMKMVQWAQACFRAWLAKWVEELPRESKIHGKQYGVDGSNVIFLGCISWDV